MSTLDEREAYKNNPYFTGHIYGNFSPFYVTITIVTLFLGSVILLNIILGCCSKHRRYWQDRHTGNRWLVSIWTATPHKQPPLDLTELKDVSYFQKLQPAPRIFNEDIEAHGEEVPIHQHQQYQSRPPRPEGRGLHQQRQREEYVELQTKRESDI
ncbi:wurmchen 1 transmembrane protein [Haematobia irritans]|uniref:wurmchen 1 transmembrane protein n=1 Tax=Haematobia irritans TaxID=7368 RepID=UPI003F50B859